MSHCHPRLSVSFITSSEALIISPLGHCACAPLVFQFHTGSTYNIPQPKGRVKCVLSSYLRGNHEKFRKQSPNVTQLGKHHTSWSLHAHVILKPSSFLHTRNSGIFTRREGAMSSMNWSFPLPNIFFPLPYAIFPSSLSTLSQSLCF